MTRLWIMSDLHQEDGRKPYKLAAMPEHDVVVLAGDITGSPVETVQYASQTFKKPIVCVAGNHEFFRRGNIGRLNTSAAVLGSHIGRIYSLEDRYDDVAGVRFYGSTLWTSFDLHNDRQWAMAEASMGVADFTAIPGFTPALARERHLASVENLDLMLREAWDGPRVVVTHHAPSPLSQSPTWAGSRLAPSFTSDLTDLIMHHQPDVWIHGHLHDNCDYRIGRTRVVCNPKGYGSENAGFDPCLVVEVGT